MSPSLDPLPLRLPPGVDLREALQAALAARGGTAAFVLAGIGSLEHAQLRLADAPVATRLDGPLEILSLAGTLSPDGPHLHMAVADAQGRVTGGHVAPGCAVRTTAEVLMATLPGWRFARVPDAATGWAELLVSPAPGVLPDGEGR